jgi:hypothetical protein
MKVAPLILVLVSAIPLSVGCLSGGTTSGEIAPPVVTVVPDDFVLRDVRKDAAHHLDCQVPDVGVAMGPWAGSEGNVTAYGCGFQVTYYLRCLTNHQCSVSLAD